MFDFANPHYLYLLLLVPGFALLYLLARMARKAKLRKFGRPEVIASLMPDASRYTPAVKITLALIALAALVIVVARPRSGGSEEQETAAGIEVMIAFDVSNSMLASSTDRHDGISRLDRARLLLEKTYRPPSQRQGGIGYFRQQLQGSVAADWRSIGSSPSSISVSRLRFSLSV